MLPGSDNGIAIAGHFWLCIPLHTVMLGEAADGQLPRQGQ